MNRLADAGAGVLRMESSGARISRRKPLETWMSSDASRWDTARFPMTVLMLQSRELELSVADLSRSILKLSSSTPLMFTTVCEMVLNPLFSNNVRAQREASA